MDKIKVGVLFNTHGLKGEVKVKSFSDFDSLRFGSKQILYLYYHNEWVSVEVKTMKTHQGVLLLTFKDMEDINCVEKYKGCEIYIDRSQLHSLEEEEVYFFDLMNCEVFDEDENCLGLVEDVIETGANAVLRVNKTLLIPYVKDFIIAVDIEHKKIVVHLMKGLL